MKKIFKWFMIIFFFPLCYLDTRSFLKRNKYPYNFKKILRDITCDCENMLECETEFYKEKYLKCADCHRRETTLTASEILRHTFR